MQKGVAESVRDLVDRLMVKVEEKYDDALVSVLSYILRRLNAHKEAARKIDEKLDNFEDRLGEFERTFDSTKATVDSDVEKKKGITKAIWNAVIVALVAYLLSRIGIG